MALQRLDDIPVGSVFKYTFSPDWYAVKSEYALHPNEVDGPPECVIIGSGEFLMCTGDDLVEVVDMEELLNIKRERMVTLDKVWGILNRAFGEMTKLITETRGNWGP